jgi:hypothetical protein
MPSAPRLFTVASAAVALAVCSSAAGAAVLTRADADGENIAAFPARPVTSAELPRSRVRPNADVTWGHADPRAVAGFRAARMFGGLRSHGNPADVVHAGQGWFLIGTPQNTLGAYANHTVYRKMREPGDPLKNTFGFLYAPTFFGPGADCIEAVTVVQSALPQVWAWDWCSASPNPYAIVNVDRKFATSYIRKMPDKLPKYTVETVLASDGVTWDMVLYNYRKKSWDIVYQTSGARNPSYGLGQEGWDFFETYTNVNGSVSDVCNPFPGPIGAENISLTANGKTFVPIGASNEQPLQFDSFFCSQFQFSTPKLDEWMMKYG